MNLFEDIYNSIKSVFGIELKEVKPKGKLESIDLQHEEGSTEVISSTGGGIIGYASDLFAVPTIEVEQIKTYRSLAILSDFEKALNEIRNEVLVFDDINQKAIDLSFNETDKSKILSKKMMDKIKDEYDFLYSLLEFQKKGLEFFDRWYIDGRLFLQKIVDKGNEKDGIKKVIRIDPLKIRRVVEYPQPNVEGVYDLSLVKVYFSFSDTHDVFNTKVSRNMIIQKDAIAYIDSGIYDLTTNSALSYLYKSIVPYNNMKMMEEALMVYRVVRSPERRVFYINVGNLSKPKAEQYMQELMARFKNKLVYDSKTGTMLDRKNVLSMVEDYWLPRRDDGKGTEIQPLPGATNLGSIDDVELFKTKFLESTGIPTSRFKDEAPTMMFGRSTEMSRDEFRFKKFLERLRNRFVTIFEDLLRTQLILKNIIVAEDWDEIKESIIWIYAEDNNFVQWKEAEQLNSKLESLAAADPFVGKYFTRAWIMKNIMKMSDDEIEELLEAAEEEAEKFAPQVPPEENVPATNGGEGVGNPPESQTEPTDTTDEEEPNG
jgi:hypothetical protein